MAINLFGNVAKSLYDRLVASHTAEYDGKSQTLTVGVSIGQGRASSRLELDNHNVEGIADALESWNPDATLGVVDIMDRTLAVETDDDGTQWYTFKTSDKSKARTSRVPVEHFEAFVGLVTAYDPEAERSPAEVVRRTLAIEDGVVSFKASDKANTRAVRVSTGDFPDLARFVRDLCAAIPAQIAKYAAMSEEHNPPTL